MADCKALLVEETKKTDANMAESILEDGVVESSCWLMKPVSPISSRTNTFATVTDLQSSSDSFCLICNRICRSGLVVMRNSSNSNDLGARFYPSSSDSSAKKSPVVRAASGENNRITVYVNSADQDTLHDAGSPFGRLPLLRRNKSQSLGVFRSAIIRQLWEIHRLLLALVQETSTLKKKRDSVVDEWHGRSLSAVEMPLDSTSATSTNNNQDDDEPIQTTAVQPKQLAQPQPQQPQPQPQPLQTQSRQTSTLFKKRLSDQIQQKRQQLRPLVLGRRPATATSRSASECSFACAQTSGKQLCFASTVCVGPLSISGAAKQLRAECRTLGSGDTRTMETFSQSGFTLLSRRFVYKIHHYTSVTSSSSNAGSLAAAARLGTASSSKSNSLFSSMEDEEKVSDVIVFQRALHDSSVASNASEKRQQLVAKLSRLKLRIDAIKSNLAEGLPGKVVAAKRRKRSFTTGCTPRNENNRWSYCLNRPTNRFETRKTQD